MLEEMESISDQMELWIFGIWLINSLIWGLYCYVLAEVKGQHTGRHFWGGFFFGIANMLYLIAVPVKVKPHLKPESKSKPFEGIVMNE
jgi:hypothetical protein